MPRKPRKTSELQIYHIVIKGADRQVIFEEEKDFKKYLDILDFYKDVCHFELYAYCLMSNHVHLIIHVNAVSLSTIFRKINTTYAGWFNAKYSRTGHLQDDRYFSEAINTTEYLLSAIRYVHFNPTKAGLELFPGQTYPWNSYNSFFNSYQNFVDTKCVLSFFENINQFSNFHKVPPSEDILDIEKTRRHIPDDIAKEIIREISGCSNSTSFQNLSIKERNDYILEIHKKGVSVRQINRLTGTSRGIIERLIK